MSSGRHFNGLPFTLLPSPSFFSKVTISTLDPPYRFALLAASASAFDPPCALYRGALPKPRNVPFLDRLKIATIVSLTPSPLQDYEDKGLLPVKRHHANAPADSKQQESLGEWITKRNIKVVHVKVGKAKDGAIPFPPATVKFVLEASGVQRAVLSCHRI